MRKVLFISLLLAAACLGMPSCEKIIEFDKDFGNGIAVFALASPDRAFSMNVSRSFTVNDNPSMVFSTDSKYYHEVDSLYNELIAIKDAKAEITVNDAEHYMLTYDEKDSLYHRYKCDYVPKVGDKIELHVSAPGYKDVSATTQVCEPRKIEVVSTEVVYSDNGYDGKEWMMNPGLRYGMDSVMRITLRIHDPKDSHDYYRLKVRGWADYYEGTGWLQLLHYSICDVFTSDDVIFVDNMITKPYGDWKAGMTNVFDDHLFNGRDYTFTVESRKRWGENARVEVELQTLPSDMYYFMKSYLQLRIASDDAYTNPVGLHTNVENGWGILGSISYDTHIIYY